MTARDQATPPYCPGCQANQPTAPVRVARLRDALPALVLGAVTAVIVTACGQSPVTSYFGTCPAGNQHPAQGAPGVYRCVNP